MPTTIEAVTPAADPDAQSDPPGPAPRPQTGSATAAAASGGWWQRVSPNTVIGGGIAVFVAVIGLVGALLIAQLTAISASIDRLDAKIDNVHTGLDAKIDRLDTKIDGVEASLRGEMQAGFAQINAVLLDHTDRLALLEAHAGLAAAPPPS